MSRFDVIVVGGYFVDLIFNGLPQFPVLGKEIVGSGFEMFGRRVQRRACYAPVGPQGGLGG